MRVARPDEHEALAALTLAAYRPLFDSGLNGEYAEELADVAGRAAQADVLVAVDDEGRLLGGITYVPGPGPLAWFDGPDEAGMRMLAVAPDAQGRGVGASLVAACVARATASGKARLLLHTTPTMAAAQRLYERAGFRPDPRHARVLDSGLVLLAYVLDLGR